MGQFHSEFEMEGCSKVISIASMFLGKKSYIDVLEGTNKNNEQIRDYHIRCKGIPTSVVREYAKQNKLTPYERYKYCMKEKLFNVIY